MPLRVAFDLDGTVADMYTALHDEAEKIFSEDALAKAREVSAPLSTPGDGSNGSNDDNSSPSMRELHLSARQQMQLWDHVKRIENFWTTLHELEPGIIARIAKAAVDRRWEVIFLTTRPQTAGELVQLQSQRWLDAHGFRYPSVYVVQRSRGKIADALHLDAVVDDRPDNCLDVAVDSKAAAIMVWNGNLDDVPAGARRLGVRPVAGITEALAVLEQLDDAKNQPGVMKSLRRLMGRSPE